MANEKEPTFYFVTELHEEEKTGMVGSVRLEEARRNDGRKPARRPYFLGGKPKHIR